MTQSSTPTFPQMPCKHITPQDSSPQNSLLSAAVLILTKNVEYFLVFISGYTNTLPSHVGTSMYFRFNLQSFFSLGSSHQKPNRLLSNYFFLPLFEVFFPANSTLELTQLRGLLHTTLIKIQMFFLWPTEPFTTSRQLTSSLISWYPIFIKKHPFANFSDQAFISNVHIPLNLKHLLDPNTHFIKYSSLIPSLPLQFSIWRAGAII